MVQQPTKRKPGRPRSETRDADILTAGFQEFAEHGFEGARLDRVAVRAGIAKGTIYLYYPSKEKLFEAAVASRIGPVLGSAASIVDLDKMSATDAFRQFLSLMYGRIADPEIRTIMRIMISEGERFPQLTGFYFRSFLGPMTGVLRRIVTAGVERGEFRKGTATDQGLVLLGPAIMAAIWQMTFARYHEAPLESFKAAHIDLVLNGIKAD